MLVWMALLVPDVGTDLSAAALVQVPVEAIVLIGLAIALPHPLRAGVATAAGVVLAVLVVVHALDLGFGLALGRPFQPLTDWTYLDSVEGLLRQSVGRVQAEALLAGAAVAAVLLLVLLPLALVRLATVASRRRGTALLALTVLAATWTASAALHLETEPGTPVASAGATRLAVRHVRQVEASLQDERRFAISATSDSLSAVPADALLTGLRGKDVLFVFVES
jgi:hypothetical protein